VLSERERADVRRHVQIGERILREAGFLDAVIPLMGSHHEALDGSGYPRGLSGAEIPLGGRIIAIADAFDAMASDRAYRPALPAQAGLSELRRCAGAQFDPDLVERFCRLIEREGPSIGAGDPRPAP
jgi:HD-GYP domain-containing protein (c-di-GMP phosphodiesterase class II)